MKTKRKQFFYLRFVTSTVAKFNRNLSGYQSYDFVKYDGPCRILGTTITNQPDSGGN
jgi:hypothetical protein